MNFLYLYGNSSWLRFAFYFYPLLRTHMSGGVRVRENPGYPIGSVRISEPRWKRSDRVMVIKGRVQTNFETAAMLPLASAALAASQAGRTPTPAPQEGRAW